MIAPLQQFIGRLRRAGVRVSPAETLDAAAALAHVDLAERAAVKAALRGTLVKKADQIPLFDALFDLFWTAALPGAGEGTGERPGGGSGRAREGRRRDERARPAGGGPPQPGEGEGSTPPLLALLEADPEATERALAAAGRRARIEQVTSRVQVPYFERRMAEALGLDGFEPLLDELAERARAAGTAEAEIEERAGRLRQRRRALEARMRALIERELELNRLADPSPVPPALAEKPFDQLTEAEIELLREATARLARRLRDVRSLRLKRARRGSLDVKRTLRRNLRYGAVPVELVQRRRRVDRPRLVAVCDVSGSVGHAARFMLQLIYSLQDQFARVRSFVFVREPIEVTELFDRLPIREAVDQALRVNYYLHSDFGNTFLTLARDYLEAFDSKTTLIVLGDARNNYLDPGLEGLERIRQRARRILWLNPEQRWVWDTGDSIMATYAPLCDLVAECRNLAQLARVVDLLAVGKPRRR